MPVIGSWACRARWRARAGLGRVRVVLGGLRGRRARRAAAPGAVWSSAGVRLLAGPGGRAPSAPLVLARFPAFLAILGVLAGLLVAAGAVLAGLR